MLTISQKKPWMFFPDFIPIGHPIFDIINSTDPEVNKINSNEFHFLQFCWLKKIYISLVCVYYFAYQCMNEVDSLNFVSLKNE